MPQTTVTIINKRGLHARAAAKMAGTAASFTSRVQARTLGGWVDAKSVMSLMLLAASQGTNLELLIEGSDEQEALEALCALIAARFEEEE